MFNKELYLKLFDELKTTLEEKIFDIKAKQILSETKINKLEEENKQQKKRLAELEEKTAIITMFVEAMGNNPEQLKQIKEKTFDEIINDDRGV